MRHFKLTPYLAMIRREFEIITSNGPLLHMLLILPVVLIVIFTFFFDSRLVKAPIGIVEAGQNCRISELYERLDASPYFHPMLMERSSLGEELRAGRIEAGIILCEVDGDRGVRLILDMSDPNRGRQIMQNLNMILKGGRWIQSDGTLRFTVEHRYNPKLRSTMSYMPGLGAVVIMMICVMMISNNLVEERAKGLLVYLTFGRGNRELLLIAKFIPYLSISAFHLFIIQMLNLFLYGEYFSGAWPVLCFASILYLVNCFAIALCIGLYFQRLVTCFSFTFLCLVIPTMVLGGFMCPIENMPVALQWTAQGIPAYWYYRAMIAILYKGAHTGPVLFSFSILGGMTLIYLTIAYRRYQNLVVL